MPRCAHHDSTSSSVRRSSASVSSATDVMEGSIRGHDDSMNASSLSSHDAPGMMVPAMVNRSSTPVIRVGVIGCGLVAQVMHLPHLRELQDRFEVAAVC